MHVKAYLCAYLFVLLLRSCVITRTCVCVIVHISWLSVHVGSSSERGQGNMICTLILFVHLHLLIHMGQMLVLNLHANVNV